MSRAHVLFYRLADGTFTGREYSGPDEMLADNTPADCGALDASLVANWRAQRVDPDTRDVVAYQPPPPADTDDATWSWDAAAGEWVPVPTVASLRRDAITRARIERDRRIYGGFAWGGSTFDSDEASQSRILGLFVSTTSSPGIFPVAWRLADNTWRPLSAADAAGVWSALQAHIASLFAAFAAHETAISALADAEAIAAYDTSAGWP